MNARGHLTGGVVAATAVAGLATISGNLPGPHRLIWWAVALTTLFFSLFPDVDTDSLPRRWFYRCVVVGVLYLALSGQQRLGLLMALLAMLPLLDHHRGWTHGRWMPLAAPALLGAGYIYGWRPTSEHQTLWNSVDLVFYLGAVVGWYTHLLLDGLFRIFPQDPE